MPTPGVIEYPGALDTALSLIEANNNGSSTLTSNISVSDLLIPVAQPGKFSASGIATLVDSLTAPTKIEIFVYTSKSGSNLVVPVGGRGAQGTTAQAFNTGHFVEQRPTARHHTALAELLLLLEAKLGIGAGTPGGAAQALLSDAAGASLWRAIVAGDLPNLPISQITSLQGALDGKQPLDSDLTTIAGLNTDGFLRRLSGVWQVSNPKTAFSVAFGMADPSSPGIGLIPPGTVTWICPDGVQITLTKVKYLFKNGSTAPGTGVVLNIQQGLASSGWTSFNDFGVANINLVAGTGVINVVTTADISDIVLNPGDTLALYVAARSGIITNREVTVCLIGTQQLI